MISNSIWTNNSIADLSGKLIMITGAGSGIGLETAKVLISKNADVIFATRENPKEVFKKLNSEYKKRAHFIGPLNLSDIRSIEIFTTCFNKNFNKLDILINNAGVMNPPYVKTHQGFELQFGTNHLGHFALNGLLIKHLIAAPGSRIVTVSSSTANDAEIDFNNLNAEKGYDKKIAYKQSKLANMYFFLELERKLKKHNIDCISAGAHPGYAKSNLQRYSTGFLRKLHVVYTLQKYGQSEKMGALPILRAATEEKIEGGAYIGPSSANGLKGFPAHTTVPEIANNLEIATQLWAISEKMTGIKYNFNI